MAHLSTKDKKSRTFLRTERCSFSRSRAPGVERNPFPGLSKPASLLCHSACDGRTGAHGRSTGTFILYLADHSCWDSLLNLHGKPLSAAHTSGKAFPPPSSPGLGST